MKPVTGTMRSGGRRDFTPHKTALPLWGGDDLNDEEVVVLNEQGLGDTIQFTRFAQGIVAQGGRPVFEVPPSFPFTALYVKAKPLPRRAKYRCSTCLAFSRDT